MASKIFFTQTGPTGGVPGSEFNLHWSLSSLTHGGLAMPQPGDLISWQNTSSLDVNLYAVKFITYTTSVRINGTDYALEPPTV